MVKVITAQEKHDSSHLIGKFLDESHYDILINEDTDCFMEPICEPSVLASCENTDCSTCPGGTGEERIAFKFRKNFFTKEEQDGAYWGLRKAAVETENRGMASGIIDGYIDPTDKPARAFVTKYQYELLQALIRNSSNTLVEYDIIQKYKDMFQSDESKKEVSLRRVVWVFSRQPENFDFDLWVESIKDLTPAEKGQEATEVFGYTSSTTYGNRAMSGIVGYFDRYTRIPYARATVFTQENPEEFKKSFPFLQTLGRGFEKLLPWRYFNQIKAADTLDPQFVIPGTPFTTVTVNSSFRTAAHYDAGDYTKGLSNLLVVSNGGDYTGGYLIFPEYRIAVNVRPGDLLLVNNHEILHGNTPIILGEGAERLSLVCYLREGLLSVGSWKYERYREEFINKRRLDTEHPKKRYMWSGIDGNCFSDHPEPKQDWNAAEEWYQFLLSKPDGREMLKKQHPWLLDHFENSTTLEEFF